MNEHYVLPLLVLHVSLFTVFYTQTWWRTLWQ